MMQQAAHQQQQSGPGPSSWHSLASGSDIRPSTCHNAAAASALGRSGSPSAFENPTSTSPSLYPATSTSTASPSAPQSTSAQSSHTMASNRARHHVRSFSTERRFDSQSSFLQQNDAPPSSPSSMSSSQLPVRAKRSPSLDSNASQPSFSTTRNSSASSSKQSSASNSPQKSTPSSSSSLAADGAPNGDVEKAEQDQLMRLRQAQANRRPRVMRMTPAFSSLPGKMDPAVASNFANAKEAQGSTAIASTQDASLIAFPAKDSTTVALVRSKSAEGHEPPRGLQIDLACIPTPSLDDLQGPVTTSRLEETTLRDRHGNPIKPSLKSARSSVSHFMPGRTSRSDSTPAMPSAMLTSKSVPTTPTLPKNVHFDEHLERVKLFKFKQRPAAVSRDGSPEQTETETEEEKDNFPYIWKGTGASPPNEGSPTSPVRAKHSPPPVEEQLILRLPNFPSSTRLSVDREVFLERIYLADDLRSVKGTVQVRNISFEKWVAVRYTLDHWATIGEVSAEFTESVKGGASDRFGFSIKLNELLNWPRGSAAHETKSMSLCLRYTVSHGEFWDNNDGHNYQLDFRRRPIPSTPASTPMAYAPPRASVPDSVANSTSSRARVIELARRGVGGKGVFAMEELRRQLEKLRSDDEEEELRIPLATNHEALRRRTSPPHSPNGSGSGSRSGSPSVWTARYDFGQSLRNPRSGSRTTGHGRAAALDYFSAKPMNSPTIPVKGSGSDTPSFTVSAASPPSTKNDRESSTALSFNTRFGMISPGLGDENVEHLPVANGSSSASGTPSPSATPTLANQALSGSFVPRSGESSPERFHSYPPSRHTASPGAGGSITPTGPGRQSPSRLSPVPSRVSLNSMIRSGSHSPTIAPPSVNGKHDKDGSVSSTSTEASSQSSPHSSPPSDGGSPNPFSPSVSISSVESDVTIATSQAHGSEDRPLKTLSAGQIDPPNVTPLPSLTFVAASPRPLGATLDAGSTLSLQSAVSLNSSSSAGDDDDDEPRLRPASMSDYQELVNRFCWNQEIVPSGGSMMPDMPTNGGLSKPTAVLDGDAIVNPTQMSLLASLGATSSTPADVLLFGTSSTSMASFSSNGSGSGSSTPTHRSSTA